MGMTGEIVSMNTNYLLFQLIHLAVEQDESVDQEEVMLYISENVFDSGISRGSRAHLRRFACEYAEYLIQLRKNVSRGVLLEVEKEVREHFSENLTLKELSKKYFVNSSYLGQIFRKKYGQSFKDYLSNYRINEAAKMLVRTDKKISLIAEEVGYHDTDYFISRFIEQKGCTPAKYRKNAGDIES
jgi:two-component system response regulator YesN